MSEKRKRKLKERAKRRAAFERIREVSRAVIPKLDIRAEFDYIVRCASRREGRCVGLGSLVLFSTETGDAWALDPADHFALCLARDGEPQPAGIVETERQFGIEWTQTYSMSGDAFTTVERETGRTATVIGYPLDAVRDMMARIGLTP